MTLHAGTGLASSTTWLFRPERILSGAMNFAMMRSKECASNQASARCKRRPQFCRRACAGASHDLSSEERPCFAREGFRRGVVLAAIENFYLRAHFCSRIVNCDAFLYVRFRRAGSLTTSPKTGMGTQFRQLLGGIWLKDFAAVRDGQKSIAELGIRVRHLYGKAYELRELRTGKTHVYRPSDCCPLTPTLAD